MTTDDRPETGADWSALVSDWHAAPRPRSAQMDIATVRHRVDAHRRMMTFIVGLEVAISGLVLIGTGLAIWRQPGAQTWLVVGDCWLFLIVVWGFAIWNRRGTWRPLADTTEAYIALARLRCARQLRTVWLIVGAVVAQLAIVGTLRWRASAGVESPDDPSRTFAAGATALAVAGSYLLLAAWFRRRTLRELRQLDRLHEEMRLSATER